MKSDKHWLEPDWPAPANVHAATTLRTGGASTRAYSSLNPALHVGDDKAAVLENRRLIKTMLNLPSEPVWLNQVHGKSAIDAAQPGALPQADASFTTKPGIVCAVLTADCLPLLMCDRDGSCVAAVHAGWRGLLAGVISHTVTALGQRDLLVWLGPAIGPGCFEVGAEVREAFVDKSAAFGGAFKEQHNHRWLADIYQLARVELLSLGIDRIYGGGFCTMTDAERFYSYRRDQHCGRMATLIWRG